MSGYSHIEVETEYPLTDKKVGADKRYVVQALENIKDLKGVKAFETQYDQVFGEGVTVDEKIDHNLKILRTKMTAQRDAHHLDNRSRKESNKKRGGPRVRNYGSMQTNEF